MLIQFYSLYLSISLSGLLVIRITASLEQPGVGERQVRWRHQDSLGDDWQDWHH